MSEPRKFRLNYTDDEWTMLHNKAGLKNREFRVWLHAEIKLLAKKIKEGEICTTCGEQEEIKRCNIFDLPFEYYLEVQCLAKKLGIGNGTVIQRFITDKYISLHIEERQFKLIT